MKYLKRLLIICVGLLPLACHSKFTSAMLFNHGSSAAFETNITLWVMGIIFAIWTAIFAISEIQ